MTTTETLKLAIVEGIRRHGKATATQMLWYCRGQGLLPTDDRCFTAAWMNAIHRDGLLAKVSSRTNKYDLAERVSVVAHRTPAGNELVFHAQSRFDWSNQ